MGNPFFVGYQQYQTFFGNIFQNAHGTESVFFIQVAGRLVGKDHIRGFYQSSGNGNTLLLAAGEFGNLFFLVFGNTKHI